MAQGAQTGCVRRNTERAAQQVPSREVGRRRLVRLAEGADRAQIGGVGRELAHKPRLPDAGVAEHRGETTVANDCPRPGVGQLRQLGVAADEGERISAGTPSPSTRCADGERLDRSGLALDEKWRERVGLEQGLRPVEHVGSRDDLPWFGFRHESGGEVHGVAHHGVRAAIAGTDLADEDMTAVDADANGQPCLGIHEAPHGAKDAAFVVAEGTRCAADEDDLAAVVVQIGAKERHPLRVGGFLCLDHELVECRSGLFRAVLGEEPVDTVEVDERDRREPMLGFHTGQQRLAQGDGNQIRQVGRRRYDLRVAVIGRVDTGPFEQHARTIDRAEETRRQRCCRRGADHDLAGHGGALHRAHHRRARARHQKFLVARADTEEVQLARVDADRHAQSDRAVIGANRPAVGQRGSHPPRRSRRADGVIVALEQQ